MRRAVSALLLRNRALGSRSFCSLPKDVRVPVDFSDTKIAFHDKSNFELMRALAIYIVCSYRPIVGNSQRIYNLCTSIFGHDIIDPIVKVTFFSHFCAGETNADVTAAVNRLAKSGIGGIVDYAAESDIGDHETPRHEREKAYEENTRIALEAIKAASSQEIGFAALKLTSLCDPEVLRRATVKLHDLERTFYRFLYPRGKIPVDPYKTLVTESIDFDQFWEGLQERGLLVTKKDARRLFRKLDVDNSGGIQFSEMLGEVNRTTLLVDQLEGISRDKYALGDEDLEELNRLWKRLKQIADVAKENKVRVLIDAERTYTQYAIDFFALCLQEEYNRDGFPTIYNTYQCYLKDSYTRMLLHHQLANERDFRLAFKAVRGAYMWQERATATALGKESPIYPSIDKTHQNYNRVVEYALTHVDSISTMVATHNRESIERALVTMDRLNIPQDKVHFGQLYGMCDFLTYALGKAGYGVFKYLPYGPVSEVMPYLIRRAEENEDALGGVRAERGLVSKELLRRALRRS
eukprot:Rmarinus@m.22529